jgi:hypothetical protein
MLGVRRATPTARIMTVKVTLADAAGSASRSCPATSSEGSSAIVAEPNEVTGTETQYVVAGARTLDT